MSKINGTIKTIWDFIKKSFVKVKEALNIIFFHVLNICIHSIDIIVDVILIVFHLIMCCLFFANGDKAMFLNALLLKVKDTIYEFNAKLNSKIK